MGRADGASPDFLAAGPGRASFSHVAGEKLGVKMDFFVGEHNEPHQTVGISVGTV